MDNSMRAVIKAFVIGGIILIVAPLFIIPAGIYILMEEFFGYSNANDYVDEEKRYVSENVQSDIADFNGMFSDGSSERSTLNAYFSEMYEKKYREYENLFYTEPEREEWELVKVDVNETMYTPTFIDFVTFLISEHADDEDVVLRFSNPDTSSVMLAPGLPPVANSKSIRANDIIDLVKRIGGYALSLIPEDTSYRTGSLARYEMVEKETVRIPIPDIGNPQAVAIFIQRMIEVYGYVLDEENEVLIKYEWVEQKADEKSFDTRTEEWSESDIAELEAAGYRIEDQTVVKQVTLTMEIDPHFRNELGREEYAWKAVRTEEDIEELTGLMQYVDDMGSADNFLQSAGIFIKIAGELIRVGWKSLTVPVGDPDSFLDMGEEGASGGVGTGEPMTAEEISSIRNSWDVGLSPGRRSVCEWAFGAVGRFSYLWGSSATGAGYEHAKSSFDCSHFVCWVFWSTVGTNFGNSGTGAMANGDTMFQISRSDLKPGDLAFKKRPGSSSSRDNANHVLIFVGYDTNHNEVFVHCTSGRGTVCTTYGNAAYFYRPTCFAD